VWQLGTDSWGSWVVSQHRTYDEGYFTDRYVRRPTTRRTLAATHSLTPGHGDIVEQWVRQNTLGSTSGSTSANLADNRVPAFPSSGGSRTFTTPSPTSSCPTASSGDHEATSRTGTQHGLRFAHTACLIDKCTCINL
jgi:hypothetical protein